MSTSQQLLDILQPQSNPPVEQVKIITTPAVGVVNVESPPRPEQTQSQQ